MFDRRYIVAQVGARRGYAVPAILASAGLLERLYTDVCGNVGCVQSLAAIERLSPSLTRLMRRQVPESVIPFTKTFPIRTLAYQCLERLHNEGGTARYRRNLAWQIAVGKAALRKGFGKATHFFSMLGEFPTLVAGAKERGLFVVSEVYTLLRLEEIVQRERANFPQWEPEGHGLDDVRRSLLKGDVMLEMTDLFLCPSASVRDDLVSSWGVSSARTAVVPYGVHPQWFDFQPTPQKGRILFVGNAGLGKGIHYLAMAAESLASTQPGLEFRVAGNVTSMVARQPLCKHLNFLGRVPRGQIRQEFLKADIFVLPSLAEGSAESTYEALAAGVPVITTRAAGSVVRDGIEGLIVPERDPEALANAIQYLLADRSARERMSFAARERARDYTWDRYGQRLLSALNSVS